MIRNTQWEVLLSKQVNYSEVVVKCQILQKNAFFKILICKNFKIWNIQILGVLKDFQGPVFFSQNSKTFKDFSKTLWALYILHNAQLAQIGLLTYSKLQYK